ncbi:hypothetical protein F5Y15DRAFT_416543 [Xylariaceae sp. FL0016]|nr:hypothetical protein F5Y15DRAFT_416543 [Xylariaceae sp. FL0016]
MLTIHGLSALLGALPEDVTKRDIIANDVERLDRYSRRVQRLRIVATETGNSPRFVRTPKQYFKKVKAYETPNDTPWFDLWERISNARPETSDLLPNLREIRADRADEAALFTLIGISGTNLEYVRIVTLHYKAPESITKRFLDSMQDVPRFKYLFIRDGQIGIVPPILVTKSSLEQLHLPPSTDSRPSHGLGPKTLHNNSILNLSLNFTTAWYTPEVEASNGKYLPSLRTL